MKGRDQVGYRSPLIAVIAAGLLVSSAAGQPPENAPPVVEAAPLPELRHSSGPPVGPPVGPPPPWVWRPTFFDEGPLTLRVEYVNWRLEGNSLPPLVSTAPAGEAPILGAPGARTLFGGREVDTGGRAGVRSTLGVRLGHWLPTDLELEGHLLILGEDGRNSGDFFAASEGAPILGRPFFNVQTDSPDALLVAAPDLPFTHPGTGDVDATLELDSARLRVESTSDLDGAGAVFRRTWASGPGYRVDVLAGYRYLRFQERLGIVQHQTFADPADPLRAGAIESLDSFSTWSEFHGGDLGIVTHLVRGPVRLELLAKVALGSVHQTLDIRGASLVDDPNAPEVVALDSGVLATSSNIGRHSGDRFGAVPEIGITLRRSLIPGVAATVGYSLMMFPHVLRTGDQIDTAIDPSQATARPRAALNDTDVWIHGVHVGLEF